MNTYNLNEKYGLVCRSAETSRHLAVLTLTRRDSFQVNVKTFNIRHLYDNWRGVIVNCGFSEVFIGERHEDTFDGVGTEFAEYRKPEIYVAMKDVISEAIMAHDIMYTWNEPDYMRVKNHFESMVRKLNAVYTVAQDSIVLDMIESLTVFTATLKLAM